MRSKIDLVAVILALCVTISIISLTVGVVWSAIKNGDTAATLTENETQVLISAFGGIFGILGAYIGYKLGNGDDKRIKGPPHPDDPSLEVTSEWPQP
jgi:hypothetical protein